MTATVDRSSTLPRSEWSLAMRLAALDASCREELIDSMSDVEVEDLLDDWTFWARPKQLAPEGDWRTWVLRAGRGFGKTRAGAEWAHERAMIEPRWIALVAKTPADARDYMIEGPGGILRNVPEHERPLYEPSKRRLTWPNGSWATVYSSEEPDQLRGFSGDTAWLDEFAKWRNPRECWDNLNFGMREASSDRPRICITTTPRPLTILREIESRRSTVTVLGSSYDNRSNLDPTWFEEVVEEHAHTRLGRQEVWAEILDDVPGALWRRNTIDRLRLDPNNPLHEQIIPTSWTRIVVAIDPAVTSGENADKTGIIVAGTALCPCKNEKVEKHAFVFRDATCRKPAYELDERTDEPRGWAKDAIDLYDEYDASRIVAEVNNGGDLVESTIRSVRRRVSYRDVRASRGKRVRAEPIASLYEQGKVHHVGIFPDLEDQMVRFVPDADEWKDGSPDRVDALVWALTDLMLGKSGPPRRQKPLHYSN